jgi:enoyl-CoA hydratase/carnithine racemase
MDEAMHLARRLTAAAPLAQRATKEMAARGARLPWEDAVRLGESMRRVVGATEDASEGMQAAAERRDPQWRGR